MINNQAPHTVVMIRPASFGFNEQTAQSNAFQQLDNSDAQEILAKAKQEFDRMVDLLRSHEIDVKVFEDALEPNKPDAVFPNNWVSFQPDGKIILYPMLAENRRLERRNDIVEALQKEFQVSEIIDLTHYENHQKFLEGTGSIIFDHPNKIAYANRSPRTDEGVLKELCARIGYKPLVFNAVDENGGAIYHTNVIMTVGTKFAVICLDSIRNEEDQENVLSSLAATDHKVVAISYEQMRNFAGNMIEVQMQHGDKAVLVSKQAFNTLLPGQIDAITRFAEMVPVDIQTIEKYGGGSVRCMVAGVHLPLQ